MEKDQAEDEADRAPGDDAARGGDRRRFWWTGDGLGAHVAADGAMWEELEVEELVARGRAGLMRRWMGPHEMDVAVEGGDGEVGHGLGHRDCGSGDCGTVHRDYSIHVGSCACY